MKRTTLITILIIVRTVYLDTEKMPLDKIYRSSK